MSPSATPGEVGALLLRCGLTVAVAESCTGGLLGATLTSVPGSSAYFRGGVIAYTDELKAGLLGVDTRLLARHGAVSGPCSRRMAEGVRSRTGADIGLSVTGVAGPSGGSAAKPVGLVYVGLAHAAGVAERRHCFQGSRETIRQSACDAALAELRDFLRHEGEPHGQESE